MDTEILRRIEQIDKESGFLLEKQQQHIRMNKETLSSYFAILETQSEEFKEYTKEIDEMRNGALNMINEETEKVDYMFNEINLRQQDYRNSLANFEARIANYDNDFSQKLKTYFCSNFSTEKKNSNNNLKDIIKRGERLNKLNRTNGGKEDLFNTREIDNIFKKYQEDKFLDECIENGNPNKIEFKERDSKKMFSGTKEKPLNLPKTPKFNYQNIVDRQNTTLKPSSFVKMNGIKANLSFKHDNPSFGNIIEKRDNQTVQTENDSMHDANRFKQIQEIREEESVKESEKSAYFKEKSIVQEKESVKESIDERKPVMKKKYVFNNESSDEEKEDIPAKKALHDSVFDAFENSEKKKAPEDSINVSHFDDDCDFDDLTLSD